MQQAGLRAFVGKLSMDISSRPTYIEPSAQDSLAAAESFASKCQALMAHLPEHRRLVEPVITPRFVPTCSDELLTGLGAMSETRSLRVQSHLAEAYDQVEWVKAERGMDDIDVFDKVSVPPTINCFSASVNAKQRLAAQTPDIKNYPSTLHLPRTTLPISPMRARYISGTLSPLQRILFGQTISPP